MIVGLFHFVWKVIWNTTVVILCAGLIFVGFKANQPMSVAGAPEGMTYFEFMKDRIDVPFFTQRASGSLDSSTLSSVA